MSLRGTGFALASRGATHIVLLRYRARPQVFQGENLLLDLAYATSQFAHPFCLIHGFILRAEPDRL